MNNTKEAIKNKDVSNLIIHSDHGYQYSSIPFKKILNDNNIKQSMSRIGNSLDNRPIEYFFSILKQEYLWTIQLQDRSFDKINKELEYIKWHYNNVRFQSNLQNKIPCEYMVQ